jgi:hypothetical protein
LFWKEFERLKMADTGAMPVAPINRRGAGEVAGGDKLMGLDKILRCVVPLVGLALLAIFATLYSVDRNAYYSILNKISYSPFTYPFLDWEFISASIKCWSEGINVYINNCDVMNTPFNYSPLWLRAVFVPTDKAWTIPIGFGIALTFLLSLFWLVKPSSWRELIVFTLTCFSPMVFFGLERGNVDVIMFIMLVVAGILSGGSLANRIVSYTLILLAGLLKFYPLIALLTALRERARTLFAVAVVSSFIIIAFFYHFREELVTALGNLPHEGFSSLNLPFHGYRYALRLFPRLYQFAWSTTLPYVLLGILIIVTAIQVIHLARDRGLVSAFAKVSEKDSIFLVIGAAVISGCFFAGYSIAYRGIHLIFVVVGFIAMRRAAEDLATRATLSRAVMILVLLMWAPPISQALAHEQGAGVSLIASALFYLIREVLWWRLVALLLAMLSIFIVGSQLFAALQQWRSLRPPALFTE